MDTVLDSQKVRNSSRVGSRVSVCVLVCHAFALYEAVFSVHILLQFFIKNTGVLQSCLLSQAIYIISKINTTGRVLSKVINVKGLLRHFA